MALHTYLTDSVEEAASYIRDGKLVAFPTETVYGLGANALEADAIRSIFAAKERPADNPLIVHVHAIEQITTIARCITPLAQSLIEAFFPGPLTVILDRSDHIPSEVSAGLSSVAIRMPANETALSFIKACGVPVVAPSANRSGRPSPTTWQDVYTDMKGRISCILTGDQSLVGLESTVVDCRKTTPYILRAGGVSRESIEAIVPDVVHAVDFNEAPSPSPGVKYRHYAPRAHVQLVDSPEEVPPSPEHAYIGIHPHETPEKLGLHASFDSIEAYAHELFHFFRRSDRAGIQSIFCEITSTENMGLALMDRIKRASKR